MPMIDNEQRFRALVEASSEVVYSVSPDWREIRYLYGRDFIADQIEPSCSWLDKYIHPEDQAVVTAAIAEAVRTRRVFQMEHRVMRVDGSPGWTWSRAVPIFDAHGGLVEWIGTASDVTSRRHAEQALADARAQSERQRRLYEAILANTPDLIYVWNLDHRFVYANEGLLRMYGKTWAEVIGRNCLELGYEPWHAEMHDREIDQVAATGTPVRGEVPFHGTFGRRVYDYILVPVFGPDGRVEAVAGTTRDVTDYRDSDRRKDEFIATLSHELRNPLAPLRNALHVMRTRQHDAALEPLCALMGRQVEQLVRLVDDLSEISRISCDLIELRRECIDLATIVRSAVETSEPLIDAAGHRLDVSLADEALWVDGDPMRLTQIVANLLNNAARYMEDGGMIALTARREGDTAVIGVRDNGIGISAEGLTRVFDMFSREGREASRNQSGLGIGLTLSRRLAEMHGGSLEARSDGEGRGSEFLLYLPLTEAPTSSPSPPAAATRCAARRILVVDDNCDAADSMAMILGHLGADVEVAYGGHECLEAYSRYEPDVVLLDIGMPGIDGYEVARRLRAQDPGGAVLVALTGWGQEEARRKGRDAGFDHHLVKPVDLERLRALLDSLATQGPQ
ncbi:MAG: ATP-binding protein [Gammaproteobacteria bacterium]